MAAPPGPPAATPAAIAIVTVSYGSEGVLENFLSSIPASSRHPLRIVVADNKPENPAAPAGDARTAGDAYTAGTAGAVARMTLAAGAAYLPLENNRGYGHAVNAAVQTLPVEIDWVVVSNPDVTLTPGVIDTLFDSADAIPTIGAIGPRILSSTGEVYPSARKIPSLRSGVGHALFGNLWPKNPWSRGYRRDDVNEVAARDAGWLSGAFLMIRRSVFDELKGFDEGYFMYFEDVDLGYRIGQLGLRNVYEPASSVIHTGAHATQDDAVRMIQAHHDSAMKFLSKKYSSPLQWPLRAALRAGLSIRARLAARRTSL